MSLHLMNIPLMRICFRQSRSHLLRTLLLVFGIAMGVAGVVAIDIAKTSVSKSFDLSVAALTSRSTHQIIGGNFKIPQKIFTDLRTRLGIYASAPVITAHVRVKELGSKTVTLTGIDPFSETRFRDLTIRTQSRTNGTKGLSGLLTQKSGVLISREDSLEYGVKMNSIITLLLGTREIPLQVTGFLDSSDSTTSQVFQGLVVTDISCAQEILDMKDKISRIDLILDDPSQVDEIKAMLPKNVFLVQTGRQNQALRRMSLSFETSLTAFSMLALFMGIFLIYNTVSFSVAQRRELNGTLRALGATKGDIFLTVMTEVMIYAAAGSVLGVLLGIVLGNGAVKVVCGTVSDLYFVLTVSRTHILWGTVLKGVAAGIFSSFAAAVFPAWTASLTPPVTLMRRSMAERAVQKHLWTLTFAGLFITGVTAVCLGRLDLKPETTFLAIFLIFFGCSLLTPPFILSSIRLLRKLAGFFPGVLMQMAMGNMIRSLSRTSVLIASLMVVTSVYIGIDMMTHSFRLAIIEWTDHVIGGDIHVESGDELNRSLDAGMVKQIEQMEAVQAVSSYSIHRIFLPASGEAHVVSYVKDLSEKHWSWTAESEKTPEQLIDEGWIAVSEIFAKQNHIRPGPSAHAVIETVKGPVSFPVAGIFRGFFMAGGRVIVSRDTMKTCFGQNDITAMQIFLKPDRKIELVMEKISSLAPGNAMLRVRSGRAIKERIMAVFNKTFVITSALQVLTAIVALTGILNSVMALLLERTRELGILRACGALRHQLLQLLLIECGLAGLLSGIMAVPVGIYLAWILIAIVNQRSFGWTYDMVLSPMGLFNAVLFAFAAALAAGIFPALRAGRTDICAALRME